MCTVLVPSPLPCLLTHAPPPLPPPRHPPIACLQGRPNIPKFAIITSLAGQPTPDLESFARVLAALAHGQRVPLEWFSFSDRHRRRHCLLHIDRQWYGPPVYWTRNDSAGAWTPTIDWPPGAAAGSSNAQQPLPLTRALPAPAPTPAAAAAAAAGDVAMADAAATATAALPPSPTSAATADAAAAAADAPLPAESFEELLRCCLVLVDVDIPLVSLSDGVHARSFSGNGLLVHYSPAGSVGLVLVDRNTVAVGPCDVLLSFGAHPCEALGRVVFLHPLHNFALVAFDPAQLNAEVSGCEARRGEA